MNRIREVDRAGAGRQVLDIARRGEAENVLIKQVQVGLDHVHEFLRVGLILLPLEDLMQPVHLHIFLLAGLFLRSAGLLILPVRRDTELRRAVHLEGTDLDLERYTVGADDRRMQRLVHVRLRHRDVVLETARNRGVHLMDHAERRIAVPYGLHDDADREQIIDLVDGLILVHHLTIDGEEVLHTTADLGIDARLLDMLRDFRDNVFDPGFSRFLLQVNLRREIIVDVRLEVLQRQIIHLDLDLTDTETLCERGIDLKGLTRLLLLLRRRLVLQRAEIMETVGELDDDDTDILRHRHEHLPEILGLHLHLIGVEIELCQLCDAIDEQRHIRIKFLRDFIERHAGILDDVVQKSRGDGFLIHLEIGENDSNTKRVNDVRFTRFTLLILMLLLRYLVGLLDHAEIIGWMVCPDGLNQFLI